MKRTCAALASILLLGLVVPVYTIDVSGTLIDVSCFMKDKSNTGLNHKMPQETADCAIVCAKKGDQVGLLTDSGEVVLISGPLAANNNARLYRLMGSKVSVQGSVSIADNGQKTILGGAIKRLDAAQK